MPIISIRIKRSQHAWLKKHPVISLSGLVQQIIREEKNKDIPFNFKIKKKKNGDNENRSVKATVSISISDKIWLDNIKKQRNSHFLSGYVRKRLDYIIQTGIINLTVSFNSNLESV